MSKYGTKEDRRKCKEAALSRLWQAKRDAMRELKDFVAGDRYAEDEGQWNKDKRLVQIRGQETDDTIRHVVAKLTEKPRSIETHAVDSGEDADDGEIAAALLEQDWGNVWKCFDSTVEAAIHSACKQRLGVMAMDWVPDYGPPGLGGEIFDRWVRPDRVMWDDSFEDPHHPLCPWMMEEKRIDVDYAREIYKAPWLQPDSEADVRGTSQTGRTVAQNVAGGERSGNRSMGGDDNKVTLEFWWLKNDKTMKVKRAQGEPLDPGERYMSCTSGCGYRSDTQEVLQQSQEPQPFLGGMPLQGELPEDVPPADALDAQDNMVGGCPTCGGALDRIDTIDEDQTMLAYKRGRRLCIDAPYCQAPSDDKTVFDGPWPVPARSFPFFVLTRYQEPGDPVGPCDVDKMWNQQQADDQIRTLMIQRVFEHRTIIDMPAVGYTDIEGNRFEMRDDQSNIMLRDATVMAQWGEQPVRQFNAQGLDPNAFQVHGVINDALTRYAPKLDIGSAEENTRDIAVGTIERITKESEVSTDHFIRRKNDALSKYAGVRWDYIRYTYTQARIRRLNMDGIDVFSKLRGDDMPGYDFVISESPQFTGLDKARAEAWPALLRTFTEATQLGLDPLQSIEVQADLLNLPRSVVRKFQKMIEEMQSKQMAAQEQAAAAGLDPGVVAGGGGGAPPSDQGELQQLMGGMDVAGNGAGPVGA